MISGKIAGVNVNFSDDILWRRTDSYSWWFVIERFQRPIDCHRWSCHGQFMVCKVLPTLSLW